MRDQRVRMQQMTKAAIAGSRANQALGPVIGWNKNGWRAKKGDQARRARQKMRQREALAPSFLTTARPRIRRIRPPRNSSAARRPGMPAHARSNTLKAASMDNRNTGSRGDHSKPRVTA